MQQNTSLYDSLNVTAAASTSEIKKAYRNAALKYHPDKNNHTEESKRKFQEICQAYEILKDNRLRALYDQYGTTDEVLIQAAGAGATPTSRAVQFILKFRYGSNVIPGSISR